MCITAIFNCPAGTFFKYGSCIRCEKGFYQAKEAQLSCTPCPQGSTTLSEYAKSQLECKAPCKPGTYSESGIESCLACPIGTYQGRGRQTKCFPCPIGLATPIPGATSLEQCQGHCKPGNYSSSGLTPCKQCPFGTYQSLSKQSMCRSCPNGTYTAVEGAWSKDFCQIIDECLMSPCLNNGFCYDLEKGYKCICRDGFTGDNCEVNVEDCSPGICKNDGTCVDQVNGFMCVCPTGFKGRTCVVNIDDCKNNHCRGNSVCVDGLNSYTCACAAGFTGRLCEINYNDCASNPCVNGGTCFDHIGNFTCCCPPGYEGWTCAEEVDECHSQPCQNGGHCIDGLNSYRCLCQPGYASLDCEIELDECYNVTCLNGGSCKDLVNDFKCICLPGFIGTHCQIELSSNFDLLFPSAKLSDFAIYRDIPDLYAFTISFWMETSDEANFGTPISYATIGLDGSVVDNAITLLNYKNFILDINGEHIYTGVKANDGVRHHICITWDSLDGSWYIYLDNVLANSDGGVQRGNFIRGGGAFVIGQEQDSLGGSFVQIEAFVGRISQVNVFDYVLSAHERLTLFKSCQMYGNVLAWPLIATAVQGELVPAYSSAICQ
ncbi:sushi, von Willebrand factor type A, EGF and pentraxin domain-containing protein 1-like, partial [Anneissia japonica]|uniref:sushi, von Willebrand factor type A, EGF and pentraxin domain-containing protein 1-like n=1 Tax=Anneissia japonica TaxID=1529436 RepID=UPI0014257FAC